MLRRVWVVLPWIILLLAAVYFWQQNQQIQQQLDRMSSGQPLLLSRTEAGVASYHRAVQVAAPAVVNIYTTQKVSPHAGLLKDPHFRQFFEQYGESLPDDFEQQEDDGTSLGSGVIVAANGYILTNSHVIEKADQITVALQDGRRAEATVVGADPESDLAVIKVDLTGLPVLPFKKSANLVGDVVLAIGNPFGVGQTVTQGIISATGRSGLGINTYEDFIQTDAAINPGNSGGALIDVAGNLVGINTAIFSRSGGSMGIGFAIPAALAQQVMTDIIQNGKVRRGWLGIEVGADTDPSMPARAGVLVLGVMKQGPAAQAGLKFGDRILKVNQQVVSQPSQLVSLIGRLKPASVLQLQVQRSQQQLNVQVTIAERPDREGRDEQEVE